MDFQIDPQVISHEHSHSCTPKTHWSSSQLPTAHEKAASLLTQQWPLIPWPCLDSCWDCKKKQSCPGWCLPLATVSQCHCQWLCEMFCSRREDAHPQLPQEEKFRAATGSRPSIWVRNKWKILQKVVSNQMDHLPQGWFPKIVEHRWYMSCFIAVYLPESNPFKISLNWPKIVNLSFI